MAREVIDHEKLKTDMGKRFRILIYLLNFELVLSWNEFTRIQYLPKCLLLHRELYDKELDWKLQEIRGVKERLYTLRYDFSRPENDIVRDVRVRLTNSFTNRNHDVRIYVQNWTDSKMMWKELTNTKSKILKGHSTYQA